MKQRTYLITLHLFDHLARSLPLISEIRKRRNVTSPVRRSFVTPGLTSLSSHISTGNTEPGNPGEFLNTDDLGGQTTRNVVAEPMP
jgi:hypothetical protein